MKSQWIISGMSDPDRAIERVGATFHGEQVLPRLLRFFGDDAMKCLDGIYGVSEGFSSSTITICHDHEMEKKISHDTGLSSGGESPLLTSYKGYVFTHSIHSLDAEFEDEKRYRISYFGIDKSAVQKLEEFIGKEKFRTFERAYSFLCACTNHDYTTHGIGVVPWNKNIRNNISIPVLPRLHSTSTGEMLAAIFHRDLLEEIDETTGGKIIQYIEKQADLLLSIIDAIEDDDLRNYFLVTVKYPLFSLINPKGGSEERINNKRIINRLRSRRKKIKIRGTDWGKSVHQEKVSIKISGEFTYSASVRELRKIIFSALAIDKTSKIVRFSLFTLLKQGLLR